MNTTQRHTVGQTVAVWFDADRIYIGKVVRVHSEHLVVHLFDYTARVKVCPTYALPMEV